MTLSQDALQGVLASSTDQAFLQILKIEHSNLSESLKLVADNQDRDRLDGTYQRFPFQVQGPGQDSEKPPRIQITSDIVDRRVIQAIRSLSGLREKATITYSVIRPEAPDDPEYGPVVFEYADAKTDGATSFTIEATFLKGALQDAFPAMQFAPSNRG